MSGGIEEKQSVEPVQQSRWSSLGARKQSYVLLGVSPLTWAAAIFILSQQGCSTSSLGQLFYFIVSLSISFTLPAGIARFGKSLGPRPEQALFFFSVALGVLMVFTAVITSAISLGC